MSHVRLRLALVILMIAVAIGSQGALDVVAQEASPAAATAQADCAPMTQSDAEEIVLKYWAGWNAKDVSMLDGLLADDYVHHWGIGVDVTGAAAMQESIGAFLTAFPDFNISVDEILLAGDVVINRWTATGTQREPFRGVSASDLTTTWTGINLARVECGVIVEGWSEADHFGRLEQQGVFEGIATPEP